MASSFSEPRRRPGFTLVELLVVIGIIVILLGLVFMVGGKVSKQAREVTERNAARQALIAWSTYSFDND